MHSQHQHQADSEYVSCGAR